MERHRPVAVRGNGKSLERSSCQPEVEIIDAHPQSRCLRLQQLRRRHQQRDLGDGLRALPPQHHGSLEGRVASRQRIRLQPRSEEISLNLR